MQVVEGVYRPEGLRTSNAYVVVSGDALTLIDTGTGRDVALIVAEIEQRGHVLSELGSIILTHAHSDHRGGVGELVRRTGTRVLAHREEVPYLQRSKSLPSGSAFGRVLSRLEERVSGSAHAIEVTRPLDDGDVLDVLGGLRVIHTPGHTPGSICLYQEEWQVLFCGDLLFNGNPFTHRGGLRFPPRLFSGDAPALVRSAQRLSSLMVRVLCVGHGNPVVRDTAAPMSAWLVGVQA